LCGFLNTGILPPPAPSLPPFSPAFFASLPGQVQIINNLVGIDPTQLAALNTAPVVDIPPDGGVGMPSQPRLRTPAAPNLPPAPPTLPPGPESRITDIPPLSLTSLVKDEVVMHIATTNTVAQVEDAVRSLGLTLLASENLAITQSIVMRFRITDGRSPRDIIR